MYCNFTEYHVCYNTRFTGCTRIPGFRVYQDIPAGLEGVPGYTRFTGCTRIPGLQGVPGYTCRFTGCTRIYQVYRVYHVYPTVTYTLQGALREVLYLRTNFKSVSGFRH